MEIQYYFIFLMKNYQKLAFLGNHGSSISERKRKEESIRFTIKKRGADIAAI